ncbi:MAG: cytosine deaminase [Tagaea sp. CACIAM 22H2]|nr:cytosine deaminase [Tagaea sp. CACIAM 22H2]
MPSFFEPPKTDRYALRNVNALLEDGNLAKRDIVVEKGKIADILTAGAAPIDIGPDLKGAMVWPCPVDIHTHLDKGHIWPRNPNVDGTFFGALTATMEDRKANWNAADVEARFDFGVATAYARGVSAIRTHLDSFPPQAEISWPVFAKLRDKWAGKVTLQASSIVSMDLFATDGGKQLADLVAKHNGLLGCVTRMAGEDHAGVPAGFDELMEKVFILAEERGLDLDLHVDETDDTTARTLIRIAKIALKRKFKGKIQCGHCCSLSLQEEDAIAETVKLCADAGIAVVSLPMCNMYLQGRKAGRTPRWRGVTVLHEMRAAGMNVAVGGDNVRDPFYAYGDHDMAETFVQAVRILQLDHPLDGWALAATKNPAETMRLPQAGRLAKGVPADLIVFKARSWSEFLSRAQGDRTVIRNGKAIDTTPPDFAELDGIVGAP